MTPHYWRDAQQHLSNADPVMARLIAAYAGEMLHGRGEAFYTLARSIVGQQISVKAADAVWGKLESLHQRHCEAKPKQSMDRHATVSLAMTPANILSLSDDDLRACGLSRQKIVYLREIANYFDHRRIGAGYFDDHSDEEVIKALTSIKGIGVWTAEMFLMFHLLRPDVLPLLDIGLQKGMITHYEGFCPPSLIPPPIPKKHLYAAMTAHAQMWQPYRSVATWYLWRSLDPVPVEY